jgi:Na+(H+)/acetate symporter ActP
MQPLHTATEDETKFVRKTVCELLEEKRDRQHVEISNTIEKIDVRTGRIEETLMGTYERPGVLTKFYGIEKVVKSCVSALWSILCVLGFGIMAIVWAIITHQVHLIPADQLHNVKPTIYKEG